VAKFLITYHGGGGVPSNPEQAAQAKAAFGQWLQSAGPSVIDPGAPLRFATRVAESSPASDVAIGGYTLLDAPNVDAAVALLKAHPFVARGGTLQVHEAVQI
jgi:hypothetical protein